MKFAFQVIEKKKYRRGTVEAMSREQALAGLEAKGLVVESLKPISQEEATSSLPALRLVCASLCGFGLLAALWSVGFQRQSVRVSAGQNHLALEVSGTLKGDLQNVGRVSVLFPQLPARIEGEWEAIGQPGGTFALRRELSTSEDPPGYFHLRVTDKSGEVVAEEEKLLFDASTGKGRVGVVEIRIKDL